jgi:hypothetical protein
LFSRTQIAAMRDRTAARNYSATREEFRRQHEIRRAWGLKQRHAEKLRRIRGPEIEGDRAGRTPPTSSHPATDPQGTTLELQSPTTRQTSVAPPSVSVAPLSVHTEPSSTSVTLPAVPATPSSDFAAPPPAPATLSPVSATPPPVSATPSPVPATPSPASAAPPAVCAAPSSVPAAPPIGSRARNPASAPMPSRVLETARVSAANLRQQPSKRGIYRISRHRAHDGGRFAGTGRTGSMAPASGRNVSQNGRGPRSIPRSRHLRELNWPGWSN